MPGTVNCSFIGQPDWNQLPASSGLNKFTVYVWHGVTANLLHLYDACFAILDEQERIRALRYYQTKDRERYVIQHGILRVLLSEYLYKPARDISFSFNANKKPHVNTEVTPCHFNISHSAGEFLIAIGEQDLGVDIELINPDFAYADVASQYFSTDEVAYINASSQPSEAFFLLWTRKEALLKACGTGIDDNLPDMPALNGKSDLPVEYFDTNWRTESFYTMSNCIGSVTYLSPQKRIIFRKIDTDWIDMMF